jgi:hypothetical protein
MMRSLRTLTEKAAVLAGRRADEDRTRDVASGRRYVLSSSYGEMSNIGHVQASEPFFFHTAIGKNQFIQIDLGEIRNIRTIRIANRTDTCFDRATNLFAILSTGDAENTESVFHFHTPPAFLSGASKTCELTIPPSPARYVTLTSPAETALHFSDLKIFAAD